MLYEKYITLADLTDKKNVLNYHSMDYPCDDDKLKNMINYYYLSQYLENGGIPTSTLSETYNNSLFEGLENCFCEDDSLSVFLICEGGQTPLCQEKHRTHLGKQVWNYYFGYWTYSLGKGTCITCGYPEL